MNILFYDVNHLPSKELPKLISEFLHTHLGNYGDPEKEIQKAIDHALGNTGCTGGFIAMAYHENELQGAAVINDTGMKAYVPENLLTYIAVHRNHQGKGIGKALMKEIIQQARGSIALHVESNNPALFLYKSLGFTNKYLEMRLTRKEAD